LIETHWRDLMQVVLSIREGRLSSTLLLRRLGTESRKNNVYKAFRELGRVIRTITLLRFISEPELREEITAATNKALDMTAVLRQLADEGWPVTPAAIADLSPYIRERIKRFGKYATDGLTIPPAAFNPRLQLTTHAASERTEPNQPAGARRAA